MRSSGLYPLPPSPPQSPKNTTTPAQVLPADSKATPPSSQTPPDSSAGLPPSRFVEHSRSAQDAKEDVKDDVSAGVREDAKANTTPSKQHDPNVRRPCARARDDKTTQCCCFASLVHVHHCGCQCFAGRHTLLAAVSGPSLRYCGCQQALAFACSPQACTLSADHPDSTSVSFGPQVVPIQGGSE